MKIDGINNQKPYNQTSFNGLYKIETSHNKIRELKLAILKNDYDALIIRTVKYPENKNTALVLTSETADKFLDLIGKIHFRDLKTNIPKYLNLEPINIKLADLMKELKKTKNK